MNWHTAKKLKRAMRRTFALLLAAVTLSSSIAFAAETDEKAMRELYGDD